MPGFDDYDDLLTEMKTLGAAFEKGTTGFDRKLAGLEESINELFKRVSRPGAEGGYDHGFERKDAIQMCRDRFAWERQKTEGREIEYAPGSDEIEVAVVAQRGWRKILRHGRLERLDHTEQKSLSAFSFGGTGWMVPPTLSNRILSCLTDPDDFMSLLSQESISGPSIQFPLNNSELEGANWACEEACGGPVATLPPPGMIEIKPESLRAVVCTTRDLIEDASMAPPDWHLRCVVDPQEWFNETVAAIHLALGPVAPTTH